MLTRKEKEFIQKLVKHAQRNNYCFEFNVPIDKIDDFLKQINFKISHNEFTLMLENLNSKGYFFEYTPHNNRCNADMFGGVFFCPTIDCLQYKEIETKEFIKYLQEKWIDFLAMIASVIALILSLISLLSQ